MGGDTGLSRWPHVVTSVLIRWRQGGQRRRCEGGNRGGRDTGPQAKECRFL